MYPIGRCLEGTSDLWRRRTPSGRLDVLFKNRSLPVPILQGRAAYTSLALKAGACRTAGRRRTFAAHPDNPARSLPHMAEADVPSVGWIEGYRDRLRVGRRPQP